MRSPKPGKAPETAGSTAHLVITVRFAEGRFHGQGDWPPSPARLFQAIVAGTGTSGPLPDNAKSALIWLESLHAPLIAAPLAKSGSEVTFFVPGNDRDALGKELLNVEKIRYPKLMKPQLFDEKLALLYVWSFALQDRARAEEACKLAHNLYRLGHGVDMAWASAEVVERGEVGELLKNYRGQIYRPTGGTRGLRLACPTNGSTSSVVASYEAGLRSLRRDRRAIIRTQPPRPRFAQVTYNSAPLLRLYDLRIGKDFAAWPAVRAAELVAAVRKAASDRLGTAFPTRREDITKTFQASDSRAVHGSAAIRVLPLPSIGHQHADGAIRRVLVEVPADCPLRAEDIFWAFSNLELPGGPVLRRAEDGDRMLSNYGVGGSTHKTWHTVTPAALPEEAKRRRIDPERMREEAKSAKERMEEEMRAAAAVMRDLRIMQMLPQLESIKVQREPFEGSGGRAEAYAPGSGFAKTRLWHVEVTFMEPVAGPLVIADGRFVGLGLTAPVRGT